MACFRCPDHAPEPDRRDDVVYALRCAEALEALALAADRTDDATRHAADAERCRAKLTEIDEVARLRAEAGEDAPRDVARSSDEDYGEEERT